MFQCPGSLNESKMWVCWGSLCVVLSLSLSLAKTQLDILQSLAWQIKCTITLLWSNNEELLTLLWEEATFCLIQRWLCWPLSLTSSDTDIRDWPWTYSKFCCHLKRTQTCWTSWPEICKKGKMISIMILQLLQNWIENLLKKYKLKVKKAWFLSQGFTVAWAAHIKDKVWHVHTHCSQYYCQIRNLEAPPVMAVYCFEPTQVKRNCKTMVQSGVKIHQIKVFLFFFHMISLGEWTVILSTGQ